MEIRHDRPIEEDIPCSGRRNERLEDDWGAKNGEDGEDGEDGENGEDTWGSQRT
jgi:hypothetical protein